jgi:hypothetical protein
MNIIEANEVEVIDQTSKFDYKVEQTPLFANGKQTRFRGNVRTDTGECLGVVTEQYSVMQNEDLFGSVEELFKNRNLGVFKRREIVTGGGSRVRGIYTFSEQGIKVQKDDILFQLTIQNSFDGSLRVAFKAGLFRLVCSNGATSPVGGLVNLTKKHTDALSLDFAGEALDACVENFNRSADRLDAMARKNISQIEGRKLLNGLVKAKAISERQSNEVEQVWNNPSYREDEARTVYNLWNAVTQTTTRVAGNRFELADRIETEVTNRLVDVSMRGDLESLMVDALAPRKPRTSRKTINLN